MDNTILSRRSVRRFQDKLISDSDVNAILEAARWAPSWGNQQCCELIVVKLGQLKIELADLLSPKNPASKCVANAPVVFAVCGNPLKSGYYNEKQVTRYQHWFLYDLGLVSQNICLKAWELGIGSVIVGSFDHKKAEDVLGLPADYELVSLIPIGYPDHEPPTPKRKDISEFVHYERFSG